MFHLTPQERKFVVLAVVVFVLGASVQLGLRRDIPPVRWARSVRASKIPINSAGAQELQMLPGIGAKLSGKIVEYRKSHGPFHSVEDLGSVSGVSAKRLKIIKGLIEL